MSTKTGFMVPIKDDASIIKSYRPRVEHLHLGFPVYLPVHLQDGNLAGERAPRLAELYVSDRDATAYGGQL